MNWPEREVVPGLRVGASRETVQEKFGDPYKSIGSGDGSERWIYISPIESRLSGGLVLHYGGGGPWMDHVKGKSMTIEFQDGMVVDGKVK